jgi:hypothetical protein
MHILLDAGYWIVTVLERVVGDCDSNWCLLHWKAYLLLMTVLNRFRRINVLGVGGSLGARLLHFLDVVNMP